MGIRWACELDWFRWELDGHVVKCEDANLVFTSSTRTLTQFLILGLSVAFCLIFIHIFIKYLQQTCCNIHCNGVDDSLIPLKKVETSKTLKWAANIRNHDFSNLYHRSYYQHFSMKSSPERINAANIKLLQILETKLWTVNLFDTYEDNYQPNRDLVGKGKNTILKKECIFCKKIRRKRS